MLLASEDLEGEHNNETLIGTPLTTRQKPEPCGRFRHRSEVRFEVLLLLAFFRLNGKYVSDPLNLLTRSRSDLFDVPT